MYTQTKEGKDWFILIDFDLGVKITKEGFPLGPSARHRTGTLPFMAYELVGSLQSPLYTQNGAKSHVVQHCIRHDFESLFWVSLRCATSLVDPKLSKSAPTSTVRDAWLTELERGDPRSIARTKKDFLTSESGMDAAPLSPSFEHLRSWFIYFLQPFFNYIAATMQKRSRSFHQAMIHALSGEKAQEQIDETVLSDFALYETGHNHVTRNTLLEAVGLYEKLH